MTEAAKAFISMCYKDGKCMAFQPRFDEIYEIKSKKYKFTKEIYEEIAQSGQVKITYVGSKYVNLVGIKVT